VRLLPYAVVLVAALALSGCGGGGSGPEGATVPIPTPSLSPVGPADLSAPADTGALTGGYTGEACAAVTPTDVEHLLGMTGTVEYAVRAGTTIGTAPPAAQTSCLYASLASSVGLSLPSTRPPADVATYEAQVGEAFGGCPDRAVRELTVVGLPSALVSCPAQSTRLLVLKGPSVAGRTTAATCAVLNAELVDENRFLAFCADTLRRAAAV
jgi:hypothetical protein